MNARSTSGTGAKAATATGGPLLHTYLKLTAVSVFWAGTLIAARTVSTHMPPASAGFFRFLVATVALLVALQLSKGLAVLRQVGWRDLSGTMVLGASGVLLYNLCLFNAARLIEASRISVFVALNPVVTVLLAAIFLREQVTATRWSGIAMALGGVWVVATRGELASLAANSGMGELSMLGAVFGWAIYTLLGRRTLRTLDALVATVLAAGWGTLFLLIAAWPQLRALPASAFAPGVVTSIVYVGVFGTAIAFVWYYQGIEHIGAARAVAFNNLVPVLGVLFGWLILHEPLTASLATGCALTVGGVYLVNRSPQ